MQHRWFSGRILACHAGDTGSIPGRCNAFFQQGAIYYNQLIRLLSLAEAARFRGRQDVNVFARTSRMSMCFDCYLCNICHGTTRSAQTKTYVSSILFCCCCCSFFSGFFCVTSSAIAQLVLLCYILSDSSVSLRSRFRGLLKDLNLSKEIL